MKQTQDWAALWQQDNASRLGLPGPSLPARVWRGPALGTF